MLIFFTVIYIFVVLWYNFIKLMKKGGKTMKKAKIRTAPQLHRLKDMTTISAAKALTIKSLILTNGKSMSKR